MRCKTNVLELHNERRETYMYSKHHYFVLQSAVHKYVLNFLVFLLLSLLLMMIMNIENLTIQTSNARLWTRLSLSRRKVVYRLSANYVSSVCLHV
jgi:hypothetical protein